MAEILKAEENLCLRKNIIYYLCVSMCVSGERVSVGITPFLYLFLSNYEREVFILDTSENKFKEKYSW